MGREHARILCRIWSDDDFRARSASAQRLYMLLLSQSTLNYCGLITLTVQRWATCSPDTTTKSVIEDLHELDDHRFVIVDFQTEEALVRSFIRNDGVTKLPNVFKGALKAARTVQSERLRAVLSEELRRIGRDDAARVADEIGYSIAHNTDGCGDDEPAGHVDPPLNSDPIAHSMGYSTSIESKKPGGWGLGLGGSLTLGTTQDVKTSSSQKTERRVRAVAPASPRRDVEDLCERLHARIVGNGAKATITAQWRDAARLMLDRDGRDFDQALKLIDWATADDFWSANILSMPKFRKQYDQLLMKARNESRQPGGANYQHPTDLAVARLLGGSNGQSTPPRALPGGDPT